jgi:hypothetical protein
VAVRLGQRAEARDAFRFVAAACAYSDAELRPRVAEARAALRALTPDRKRR